MQFRNAFRHFGVATVACLSASLGQADHAPDAFTQNTDPDLVGCFASVNDADIQEKSGLQGACFSDILRFCAPGNEITQQTRECLIYETRQVSQFLSASIALLPAADDVQGEPFSFGHRYPRLLGNLIESSAKLSAPTDHLDARQILVNFGEAHVALHTLFFVATETKTELPFNDPNFETH